VDKIFYPDSVVVIGVSERPDNLAANIVRNLLNQDGSLGYEGDVYAVGLRGGEVPGAGLARPGLARVPIHTSIDELPDGIDLAVLLTPAATVPDLLDACGRKDIRRAVIESGGFSEFSEAGRALEERIIDVARRWDIRFVGPNCISVINMENGLRLPFVSLDWRVAKQGPVSVLAQSGGVSVTYLILLSEVGLGVNKVVSMGNKADLDEVDYLSYLLEDPGTEIVCLYLESIEKGRRLLELAASVNPSTSKPIIVHKANTGQASAEIAFSHTAALASDDRIVDAALRQANLTRATGFDDAVALAQGFALPPVLGDDLLIVSRSGGHAVVAADAAESHNFRLLSIPDDFLDDVRRLFRADVIAPTNPLDLGTIFDFELYGHIVEKGLRELGPDALLLVHTYSTGAEGEMSQRLVRRLAALSRELGKPVAFCAFAQRDEVEALKRATDLPIFTEIEAAMRALSASRDRHTRSARLLPLPAARAKRSHYVEEVLESNGPLSYEGALMMCEVYGIPIPDLGFTFDVEGAVVKADILGYPVALKALSRDIAHKSDVGAVVLDIDDEDEMRSAFAALMARLEERAPGARIDNVMVQKMFHGGRELILGGKRDPSFGPVVMFGLGGVYVELFEDVVFRLAPLTREDAEEMITEVRGSRILHGEPPADLDAVVDALLALSRLMVECPEVAEIDINPLLAFEEGAVAVDARVVVRHEPDQ
jgi:acetate---CoA ligase (ADP-forming)